MTKTQAQNRGERTAPSGGELFGGEYIVRSPVVSSRASDRPLTAAVVAELANVRR